VPPDQNRYRRHDDSTFLYAFDLIELNGDDLRRDMLEVRKAMLASIVAKASPGIRFNEHMEGDGPTVFAHACKMGLEGIVSKRKDSPYRSGRSPDWLKMRKIGGRRNGDRALVTPPALSEGDHGCFADAPSTCVCQNRSSNSARAQRPKNISSTDVHRAEMTVSFYRE